jgi:2-oxoglutarate ferredoxin oxidoreductase subunit gamma
MIEIICSGFGGQGILTTGMLLIEAGIQRGEKVSWYPSYGSEMRGGTANCHVIISGEAIGSPYVSHPDILIAMNEPSADKFEEAVKPGGTVLVNSSLVPPGRGYPRGLSVYLINATDIANRLENSRGSNIVILGALCGATGMFDRDFFSGVIAGYFGKKGYDNPKNLSCFAEGYARVEKAR